MRVAEKTPLASLSIQTKIIDVSEVLVEYERRNRVERYRVRRIAYRQLRNTKRERQRVIQAPEVCKPD